ncbi:SDR family oxidoreductase [Lentisphaerota bacterium ZTH]|nr:SDR family oxidoreductase [Lentisphaerota bacterium]WET05127.1 SDR family oxidoreductase [Lentisphaerota bacterium ZTH]
MKIFLTGITGLVGSSFVTALLQERNDVKIVALTRDSAVMSARQRVEETIREQCGFDECPEHTAKVMDSLEVVSGDVVHLDPEEFAAMPEMQGVDTIFHCAADVNLGKDVTGRTYKINYHGTENVIALAKKLKVKEFHYVSTAYIAGKMQGRAIEDKPIDSGFNNPYEDSKYHAEQLVRKCGIPFSIYRPSIIIGRLSDGRVRKPLAFYRILEFMAKLKKHRCSKLKADPLEWVDMNIHFTASPSQHVYFVPIDYVQSSITALFQKPVCNKAYHITGNSPVSTHQINNAMCQVLRLGNVIVGENNPDPNMDEKLMTRFLGDLLPYFSSDIIFDQSNIIDALGAGAIDWHVGEKGLLVMMRSFFKDFFPNVDWVNKVIEED